MVVGQLDADLLAIHIDSAVKEIPQIDRVTHLPSEHVVGARWRFRAEGDVLWSDSQNRFGPGPELTIGLATKAAGAPPGGLHDSFFSRPRRV